MEKSKKQSAPVIGWLLLIILISLLLALNYVKFFMSTNQNIEEKEVESENSKAVEIILQQIVENVNHNEKIKQYEADGVKIDAILSNHSIYISYEADIATTYEFNYSNFVLTAKITNEEENIKKFKQVYEILIYAVQERLNNIEGNIMSDIASFLDDSTEYIGLTKETSESSLIYKMDITKKIGNVGTTNELAENNSTTNLENESNNGENLNNEDATDNSVSNE